MNTSTLTEPITSPAKAFSEQARLERYITLTTDRAVRQYLADMKQYVENEGNAIGMGTFRVRWEELMIAQLRGSSLPPSMIDYVLPSLLEAAIPEDAYTSARIVLADASTYSWTMSRTMQEIDVAFDLNTGTPAPAPNDITAAGFWDGLVETGNRWITKMRRNVRTSSTGLFGWSTQGALALARVPQKMWVARMDDKTRDTHMEINGTTLPIDQPFIVNGSSMMYPGDRNGAYDQIVNCRCVLIGVVS